MQQTTIESVNEVIKALGGASEIRRMTGVTAQAVSNWRGRNRFSARTFDMLSAALRERGLAADKKLWGQAALPPEEVGDAI